MSDATHAPNALALFSDMTGALAAETARAAGAPTALVSITFDMMGEGQPAATRVEVVRATKSLVFSQGDILDSAGRRLLAATAVHKILK